MKKLTLFLVIFLILTSFGSVLTGVAFAAAPDKYTTVLDDLQKDETFDAAQFPAGNQNKMDVFQIAESNAGELFLYVYSPMGDKFTASEARISQSIGDNLHVEDYKLTLLSRDGTLSKYLVNGLIVKSDAVRYYVVVQLARPLDKDIDSTPSSNTETTFPYPVGKKFTACTVDGNVSYIEEHNETITVTTKWFGFIRYSNGFKLYKDSCDSWFIAFNTNRQIDYLYDADVEFLSQKFSYYLQYGGGWALNESSSDKKPTERIVKLSDKETAETKADGLFAYKYKWKRIETVKEFKENETLSEEYIKNLSDKSWVLRFTETDYNCYTSTYTGTQNFTTISDVTILRLHFRSNGKVYNLGVVDNKVSNPDGPVNNDTEAIDGALKGLQEQLDAIAKWFENLGKWFVDNWWIFIIIGCLIVLAILAPFFPVIAAGFKIVGKGLAIFFKYLGKGIWWFIKYLAIGLFYVITSPYWIIRAIVKKCKGE